MVNKITTPPTQNEVISKINELVDGKQDTLVSGTNIKTINNQSLLGSGNIDIQGGGSSYTAGDGIDITNNVISAKIATSVSSTSTNEQSVGAKLFYDTVGDIEAALYAINSGGIQTVTLTFTLTGVTSTVDTLTVNSDTYTYSDFTNDSLSLEFTSGTNILWTASGRGKFSAYPSSGSLTLSENTNVTIHMDYT